MKLNISDWESFCATDTVATNNRLLTTDKNGGKYAIIRN